MIIKTQVFNPTAERKKYMWIGVYGHDVEPGETMTLDYEPYSAAKENQRKMLEEDLALKRVELTLVTDLPIKQIKAETPEIKEPVDDKKTIIEKPKTVPETKKEARKKEIAEQMEKFGIVEATKEEMEPEANFPFDVVKGDPEQTSTVLPDKARKVSLEDIMSGKEPIHGEVMENEPSETATDAAELEAKAPPPVEKSAGEKVPLPPTAPKPAPPPTTKRRGRPPRTHAKK